MQELIKQVQEACAAECEQKVSDRMDGYRVAAAIRALDLSHLSGWQPIETAPKDGTPVLAYRNSRYGLDISSMCYVDDDWYWHYDGEMPSEPPTHWMPRPTPPPP